MPVTHWVIEGDKGETVDEDNDGVPDSGWRRADIMSWLAKYDANPGRYATKTQLLGIVGALMNPDRIEEVADLAEEPVPEENIEEAAPAQVEQESD